MSWFKPGNGVCVCQPCGEETCCVDSPTWEATWTGEGDGGQTWGQTFTLTDSGLECFWFKGKTICTYEDASVGTVTVKLTIDLGWNSSGWDAKATIDALHGPNDESLWQKIYTWSDFSLDSRLTCIGTTFVLDIADATLETFGTPSGCLTDLTNTITYDGI